MYIHEATEANNTELIELQAKCPQGTTIIVSTVNTPDFFARAKVYEDYKVYVVCEDTRIVASAACALRNALVNNKVERVGHEFQVFVDPEYRGRRIAGQLHEVLEEYLTEQGVVLSYALIIEGNKPSIRYIERQGFKRHTTLVMPTIPVFKEMAFTYKGNIRNIVPEDLPAVSKLTNDTWRGYELYEPMTAEEFNRLIKRTPEYDHNNIFVLEEDGEIMACLGFWDWSRITRVSVKAFTLKMSAISFLLNVLRVFRPMPQIPKPGDLLKQIVLTPIGFKDTTYLTTLMRYVNNKAYTEDIGQICLICEKDHPLLISLKGFIHIDTMIHLYIKLWHESPPASGKPVFINGLDL